MKHSINVYLIHYIRHTFGGVVITGFELHGGFLLVQFLHARLDLLPSWNPHVSGLGIGIFVLKSASIDSGQGQGKNDEALHFGKIKM